MSENPTWSTGIPNPPLTTNQKRMMEKLAEGDSGSSVSRERFIRGFKAGYAMALAEIDQLKARLETLEKGLPKPSWDER